MKTIITVVAIIIVLKFAWGYIVDFIEGFFERFPKVRHFCIGFILLLFTVLISLLGASSVGSFIGLFFKNAFTVGIITGVYWFFTSEKMADFRKGIGAIAIVVALGVYVLYTLVTNAIGATSMSDFITSEIASLLTPVAIYYIFKFLGSDLFVALTTKYNCTNCLYFKNGKCTINEPTVLGNECHTYLKKPGC